jgi:uncharacterized phage-like protein YoqJ
MPNILSSGERGTYMRPILAVTGHRPHKLGTGYSENKLVGLAVTYVRVIDPRELITGMALGWDTACALAAIQTSVPFVAALPFEGQDLRWTPAQKARYRYILTRASQIVTVSSGGYEAIKYESRNRWMADHCEEVLALWDGSAGGTSNMLRYAQGPGRWRKTYNAWEDWIKK